MIAVVTGSSGFIGSHLVEELLSRGATVRAIERAKRPVVDRDPRVSYFAVELLDSHSVSECPAWDGATHVFHVGGVTKRRTLAQFREGNVVPTGNLLAALAARPHRIERFVLVSSQAAAGPAPAADRPVREDDPPRPIEAYGQSKREAEELARTFADRIPITIIRPAAVYGPRDVDFLKVFKQVAGPIAVHAAPKDQQMSIVYAIDLVQAMVLAAEASSAIGQTYFVAAREAVTWRELYAAISAVVGTHPIELQVPSALLRLAGQLGSLVALLSGFPVLLNANKVALARPRWWLCDASRIREELGWTAQTSLQEGLRETYLWYRQAGWMRSSTRAKAERTEGRV